MSLLLNHRETFRVAETLFFFSNSCSHSRALPNDYSVPSSDATSSRIMHHVTKLKPSQTSFLNMTMSSLYSNGLHSHQISIQWRFSTAWYGTVRFGTVRYGSLLGGFPLGTVPGTWYFFSTTSAEVPSEPYRYQNVARKLC